MIKVDIEGLDDLLDTLEMAAERTAKAAASLDSHGESDNDLDEKIAGVRGDLGLQGGMRTREFPLMTKEEAEAVMENERALEISILGEDVAGYIVEE